MARQSLFDRYNFFVAAAVVSAHANTLKSGFRQADVRTFIEVFSNWADFTEEHSTLPIQNTQISRYLDDLVGDGFARKLPKKGKFPLYRLNRSGLMELISRLVSLPYLSRKEHFYFVFYFCGAYRHRIFSMVKGEGKYFPLSIQLELESLLDREALIDRQVEHVQQALKKLDKRIEEQLKTKELAAELVAEGKGIPEIISEVDRAFPYGINAYRRYSDMLSMATLKQSLWEIQVGNVKRAAEIWAPAKRHLLLHLEELERLRKIAAEEIGAHLR